MNTQQIKDELNRQYSSLLTLPEKAFFVGLANYTKSIQDEPDLSDIRKSLSRKALSDYDEVILRYKKQYKSKNPQTDWIMADFVKAGKGLARKQAKIQNTLEKDQIDASHAWKKLQTVEVFINDRGRAERIYSKTPRGKHEYQQTITELDDILYARKRDRDFGIESSLEEVPRSVFIQSDYQNYLALVQNYILNNLNKLTVTTSIVFPEGETVIYKDNVLYFYIDKLRHDFLDFSTSPEILKVFAVFWKHWTETKQNTLTPSKALEIYKEINGDMVERKKFADDVSHIRTTKLIQKSYLENRFQINFDRKKNSWVFHWE